MKKLIIGLSVVNLVLYVMNSRFIQKTNLDRLQKSKFYDIELRKYWNKKVRMSKRLPNN